VLDALPPACICIYCKSLCPFKILTVWAMPNISRRAIAYKYWLDIRASDLSQTTLRLCELWFSWNASNCAIKSHEPSIVNTCSYLTTLSCLMIYSIWYISNNHGFHQKHPGVLVGSDSSDTTSSPVTELSRLPVGYVPPVLWARVYTIRMTGVLNTS
jgi:hypothetical protein